MTRHPECEAWQCSTDAPDETHSTNLPGRCGHKAQPKCNRSAQSRANSGFLLERCRTRDVQTRAPRQLNGRRFRVCSTCLQHSDTSRVPGLPCPAEHPERPIGNAPPQEFLLPSLPRPTLHTNDPIHIPLVVRI